MNKFEKHSRVSYDRMAPKYDSTFDGRFTLKFKKLLADKLVISEDTVLADVACGNGRLLKMLSDKGLKHGYGTDISPEMTAQAKTLNPDMIFYACGCDQLPFEDLSIDIMTVSAAFHHFPDIEKFAAEAERTVRHGGMICIAEVYLPDVLRVICNPFVRLSRSGDVRFYSPKEIVSLFEARGFSEDSVLLDGMTQLVTLRRTNARL